MRKGGPRLGNLRVTQRLPGTWAIEGFSPRSARTATAFATGPSVRFHLDQPITLTMTVMACSKHSQVVAVEKADLPAGNQKMVWAPPPRTLPRTYLLTPEGQGGQRQEARLRQSRTTAWRSCNPAPVVRVPGHRRRLHPDGAMRRASGCPAADCRPTSSTFVLQIFQAGPENEATTGYAMMEGVPVGGPKAIRLVDARSGARDRSCCESATGRTGSTSRNSPGRTARRTTAPFIVRPQPLRPPPGRGRACTPTPGTPTTTRTATATAGATPGTRRARTGRSNLARPYIKGGAPPKWRPVRPVRSLHWLYRTGKTVDFISDDDLESFTSARTSSRGSTT